MSHLFWFLIYCYLVNLGYHSTKILIIKMEMFASARFNFELLTYMVIREKWLKRRMNEYPDHNFNELISFIIYRYYITNFTWAKKILYAQFVNVHITPNLDFKLIWDNYMHQPLRTKTADFYANIVHLNALHDMTLWPIEKKFTPGICTQKNVRNVQWVSVPWRNWKGITFLNIAIDRTHARIAHTDQKLEIN